MFQPIQKTAQEALINKISINHLGEKSSQCNNSLKLKSNPLLQKIYSERMTCMHRISSLVLSSIPQNISIGGRDSQILIIGAGLDTSYNALKSSIFVLDCPEVLGERSRLFEDECSVNYITVNFNNISNMHDKLVKKNFQYGEFTLIVIECVLCYNDPNCVEHLLSYFSANLKNSFLVIYDPLVNTENEKSIESSDFYDDFSGHFRSRKVPIKFSFQSCPNAYNILRSHFPHVNCYTMSQASILLGSLRQSSPPPHVLEDSTQNEQGEPFDEYASLALLHNSYGIFLASSRADWFRSTLCKTTEGDREEVPTTSELGTSPGPRRICDLTLSFVSLLSRYVHESRF